MDKKKRVIRDYIFIIVGSFLISVASLSIYDRAELVIGGVTGVSIIIRHLFSVLSVFLPRAEDFCFERLFLLYSVLFFCSSYRLGKFCPKTISS